MLKWREGKLGDGVVVMAAYFGAPAVLIELVGSGNELRAAVAAVASDRQVLLRLFGFVLFYCLKCKGLFAESFRPRLVARMVWSQRSVRCRSCF